jgi:hypothetical protein
MIITEIQRPLPQPFPLAIPGHAIGVFCGLDLEVAVKGRASLLKTLTRFVRSPENAERKPAGEATERFAFTAIIRGTGAMVVRVVANTGAYCPQQEYGYFETWTGAQAFAALLNQINGIDPLEAQQIIVSAALASRSMEQTH